MKFENLVLPLQNIIDKKASEVGMTINSYLESTDENYCILNPKTGLLSWDDRYDYIVYNSLKEAQDDCLPGECIIKETIAIEMLNALLAEQR